MGNVIEISRGTYRGVEMLIHQIDQIVLLGQPLAVFLRGAITGIFVEEFLEGYHKS